MRPLCRLILVSCLASALLPAPLARAAGWDKLMIWSGKYASLGNAVASYVAGPQALYFNPSNLVDTRGAELSFNFSPTFPQFTAPVVRSGESLSSDRLFLPIFSAFGSASLSQDLSVGLGIYTAGGDKSDYGEVDFGLPGRAPIRASLRATEISVGAGYKVTPELRVGAAWRISIFDAESLSESGRGLTAVSSKITDLSGTDFAGFRVGAAYLTPDRNWGIGASVRTSVDWSFSGGTHSIESLLTDPPTAVPGARSTDATLETSFPLQLSVAVHGRLIEGVVTTLEYNYYDYHKNRSFTVRSGALRAIGLPDGTQVTELGWKNSHVIRVGSQHSLTDAWDVRGAYVFATAVTPEERALYAFVAPGDSHTFVLGTGHRLSEQLQLNAAAEYSRAAATVPSDTRTALSGDYESDVWSLHLGFDVQL